MTLFFSQAGRQSCKNWLSAIELSWQMPESVSLQEHFLPLAEKQSVHVHWALQPHPPSLHWSVMKFGWVYWYALSVNRLDNSKKVGGQFIRICLKIVKKVLCIIWIFLAVWKLTFFARFSLSDSRWMADAITSTKLDQTGEIFWDSGCCLSAWVSEF